MRDFVETIKENPVIAAVHTARELDIAVRAGVRTVLLLNTDMFSAKAFADTARKSGCNVFLHMDIIDGLAAGARALDYVIKRISPSGIISADSALIKHADESGVFCIQRFVMADSASYGDVVKTVRNTTPSMAELMPGIIPRVIRRFAAETAVPVIAAGLVTERRQVKDALLSGAVGICTGSQNLWRI